MMRPGLHTRGVIRLATMKTESTKLLQLSINSQLVKMFLVVSYA